MQSLEVLSLAVNRVSTLRDVQYCYNLKELYMRKNNLTSLSEIPKYLSNLSQLRKLSLSENPMSETMNVKHYRLFVVKALPQLEKLDNDDVSLDERTKAESYSFEELIGVAAVREPAGDGGSSPSKPQTAAGG